MKKYLVTALILLCSATFATAQSSYPVDRNIDITTTAKVMVAPNKFYVQIVIADNLGGGKKGIELTEKSILIPTLKKMGIDVEKQLSFSDYDSNFNSKGKIVLSKSYQLIINDAAQLTTIISTLKQGGISDVNIMRAVYADSDKMIDSLKVEAVNKAKHSATVIADATKDLVSDVLYVRYYENNYNAESRPMMLAMKGDSANEAESYTPISFKEIELSVTMQVVFKLVKK
ncbi:MAG: SIMPL domain-containing protein [Rikenellaceae bacterium]